MDPAYEFLPTVTIAKTGQPGVKLPHYAFKTLCASMSYISDYFTDHHDGDCVVNLAPEVVVNFGHQYGAKIILICNNVQTNNNEFVTINETTWMNFVGIFELITYIFQRQESWTRDAQVLYEAIREYCKAYFTGQTENHTDMKHLKIFLAQLQLEDLVFVNREECTVDIKRAFMEMKYFCIYDLAGCM
jgi:hypothetical protein